MSLPMGEVPHRPDYPPKTPPPPKKPVEAPRPEIPRSRAAVAVQPRLRARIANRRAANWTLENAPWTPPKAGRAVVAKLRSWGYPLRDDHRAAELTARLVTAALEDGGRRISVHLADQDQQALILVLSHQPGRPTLDDAVLTEVAGLGVVSCGTDTDRDGDGCRRWALIQL